MPSRCVCVCGSGVDVNMYSSREAVHLAAPHPRLLSPSVCSPLPPHSLAHIHSLSSSLPLLCSEAAEAQTVREEQTFLSVLSLPLLSCVSSLARIRKTQNKEVFRSARLDFIPLGGTFSKFSETPEYQGGTLNDFWPLKNLTALPACLTLSPGPTEPYADWI